MDIIEFIEWLAQQLENSADIDEVGMDESGAIEVMVPGYAFPSGKRFRITVEEA